MQIVIEIDEETKAIIDNLNDEFDAIKEAFYGSMAIMAIQNGKPLPKGHGRLIDTNQGVEVQLYDDEHEEFIEQMMTIEECLNRFTNGAITIIDADKE